MISCDESSRIGSIAILLAVSIVLALAPRASAGTVDVGAGWKATAPAGYDVAPDFPNGGQLGDTVPLGNSTTVALPVKLVVPNWQSLDNICITFTNDRKSTDPPPQDHLALRLELTNKTTKDWGGFKMTITDKNNTAKDGLPNLMHPFYAHYHMIFLDANATAPFMKVKTSPDYDSGPAAVGPQLDDRGVYSLEFSDGCVMKNGTWSAKTFDLHDRAKTNQAGDYITSFEICLMPIPKAVPEPSSAIMLGLSALALLRLPSTNSMRPRGA